MMIIIILMRVFGIALSPLKFCAGWLEMSISPSLSRIDHFNINDVSGFLKCVLLQNIISFTKKYGNDIYIYIYAHINSVMRSIKLAFHQFS
jgi:hypothetical protein